MKLALLLMPLLLAGCLSTPVQRNFPSVPDDLKIACPALREVDPNTNKLSEVITVVSENYGTYQECKIKIDSWIEWYTTQKSIFESVK
jgi:hypothetical protein